MSLLGRVKTGPSESPLRIFVHAKEGMGKTTLASQIPGVIVLSCEDGEGDLEFARIRVNSWKELRAAVREILDEDHSYRVLALDTADGFERLCWEHLCEEANVQSIEDIDKGWGKGYKAATAELARFIADLEAVRAQRGMPVIALSHTLVRPFADPEGPSYDRYEPRLHKEAVALWMSWADVVAFANAKVKAVAPKGSGPDELKKGKAKDRDLERVLYLAPRPAFDAKNRYHLPDEIPLSWGDLSQVLDWEGRMGRLTSRAARVPTVEDVKAAIVNAIRNLDWVNEDVTALLKEHGATKSADVPEPARAAVIAALRVTHRTNNQAEAK